MEQLPTSQPLRRPRLVRAPLVGVAAALAAGIVAGRHAPLPAGAWLALAAAGLLAGWALLARGHLHLPACLAAGGAIFALGAAHAHLAYFTIAR